MNRCRICVMPDTRPDTPFIDGVCAACVTFGRRPQIDWEAREKELIEIIQNAKRNVDGFDCIVPSSGGKDSHWQVIKLIELGARPLVVTASTCLCTPTGRRNIENLSRYAQTVEYQPNKTVRWKLNRIGQLIVGDISWPEHVAIFTTPFKASIDFGIPLIFYGENPQAEYGGPVGSEKAREMTRRWVSEFGGFLGLRPEDVIGMDGITPFEMEPYLRPTMAEINDVGTVAYFLGQFIPWDSHRNAREATRHGMISSLPHHANYWVSENLDNAMTGLHDHGMFRKYGYGRGCAQISVDIRHGLKDRATALTWVRTFDGAFPEEYMGVPVAHVLQRIGMSRDELMASFDKFTNWEIFTRDRDRVKLNRV